MCFKVCTFYLFGKNACVYLKINVCFSDAAAQQHAEAGGEGDQDTPNYEEKAQEIVQSILQEVVNTVAGGEIRSAHCDVNKKCVSDWSFIF